MLINKHNYSIKTCTLQIQTASNMYLKEFADDNFKYDENGKVLLQGRKHFWKRRNCLLGAISPFSTVFSKDKQKVKIMASLGKGYRL